MILGLHRGNKISSTGTTSKPKAIGSKNYLFFILRNYSRKTFMYKSYIYIYTQIHVFSNMSPKAHVDAEPIKA